MFLGDLLDDSKLIHTACIVNEKMMLVRKKIMNVDHANLRLTDCTRYV